MSLSKKNQEELNKVIKNYNENNKDETLVNIKSIIMDNNPKPRTISTRYSIIKKQFKKITKDNEFLNKIKPEESITNELIIINAKIRDEKKQIELSSDMVNKIKLLSKSNDPFELAIYLLFISGRRTSELLTADFTNIKKSKAVGINGVKKRTDGGNGCSFIPITTKTKFFKLYKKFKKILEYKNINTFHRSLNRRVKKILGKGVRPHDLRGYYVTYMFKFRNKENKKINTFIRDNLCHQSINASLNYTGYKINFDKDIFKN